MKKLRFLLYILILGTASYVNAQNQIPMIMFEKIEDEKVPVAVLQTIQSEYPDYKEVIKNGAWYSHFGHTVDMTSKDQNPRAIPWHYSYRGKLEKKNVEIRFTPDGKLVKAKGVQNTNQTN